MIKKLTLLFILFTTPIPLSNYLYAQAGLNEEATQFSENWLNDIRNNVSEQDLLVATKVWKLQSDDFTSILY